MRFRRRTLENYSRTNNGNFQDEMKTKRPALLWLLAPVLLAAACEGLPRWNVELFFPFQYPDIVVANDLAIPALPAVAVPFQTPVQQQTIDDVTDDILGDKVESITADFIISTPLPVTGTIEISIADSPTNLFSSSGPNSVVTVSLPLRTTPGDTVAASVGVPLMTLNDIVYLQSRGTIASVTGTPVTLSSSDAISISVNLTANVRLVD